MAVTNSPFQAKFTDPHKVLKHVTEQNYIIATPERRRTTLLCHVNLLELYYCRASGSPNQPSPVCAHECTQCELWVVSTPQTVAGGVEDGLPDLDAAVLEGHLKNSESLCRLQVLLVIHQSQSRQIYLNLSLFRDRLVTVLL